MSFLESEFFCMAFVKQCFGQLIAAFSSSNFFLYENYRSGFAVHHRNSRFLFLRKGGLKLFLNYLSVRDHLGFFVELVFIGVGFRFNLFSNSVLGLTAGYSHYIYIPIVGDICIRVRKNYLLVFGFSKVTVSAFSSSIRTFKIPDSYKGKGIRLFNESIKLKIGKRKR